MQNKYVTLAKENLDMVLKETWKVIVQETNSLCHELQYGAAWQVPHEVRNNTLLLSMLKVTHPAKTWCVFLTFQILTIEDWWPWLETSFLKSDGNVYKSCWKSALFNIAVLEFCNETKASKKPKVLSVSSYLFQKVLSLHQMTIGKRKATVIFADFTKAFDSVNRKANLHSLRNHDILDETIQYIEGYFMAQKHGLRKKNCKSI